MNKELIKKTEKNANLRARKEVFQEAFPDTSRLASFALQRNWNPIILKVEDGQIESKLILFFGVANQSVVAEKLNKIIQEEIKASLHEDTQDWITEMLKGLLDG